MQTITLFRIKRRFKDGSAKPTDFMGMVSCGIVNNKLIPDMEQNILQFSVSFPITYEAFQKNKHTANCLYFHHSYAERDIPIGQKYTKIALMENYEILPNSIQICLY